MLKIMSRFQPLVIERRLTEPIIQYAVNLQQKRHVVIVRRKYPLGVERQPGRELKPFKNKHWLYEFVEDTQHQSTKTVKVILTKDVPGVGLENDIVVVRKGMVRNRLIPEQLAVYASAYNLKERAIKIEKESSGPKRLSLLAQATIDLMTSKPLRVLIDEEESWESLRKEYIIYAFRKDGIFVPDYAITLPEEPITDFGNYQINVTINGIKTVPVEMHVIKAERTSTKDDSLETD